ncbi:unnamed protein product [Aphanomyces euteiches]
MVARRRPFNGGFTIEVATFNIVVNFRKRQKIHDWRSGMKTCGRRVVMITSPKKLFASRAFKWKSMMRAKNQDLTIPIASSGKKKTRRNRRRRRIGKDRDPPEELNFSSPAQGTIHLREENGPFHPLPRQHQERDHVETKHLARRGTRRSHDNVHLPRGRFLQPARQDSLPTRHRRRRRRYQLNRAWRSARCEEQPFHVALSKIAVPVISQWGRSNLVEWIKERLKYEEELQAVAARHDVNWKRYARRWIDSIDRSLFKTVCEYDWRCSHDMSEETFRAKIMQAVQARRLSKDLLVRAVSRVTVRPRGDVASRLSDFIKQIDAVIYAEGLEHHLETLSVRKVFIKAVMERIKPDFLAHLVRENFKVYKKNYSLNELYEMMHEQIQLFHRVAVYPRQCARLRRKAMREANDQHTTRRFIKHCAE